MMPSVLVCTQHKGQTRVLYDPVEEQGGCPLCSAGGQIQDAEEGLELAQGMIERMQQEHREFSERIRTQLATKHEDDSPR